MLSNITITCFAASYGVTLTLEVSRLFFRLRVRWLVMIGFAAAGLFAHSAHLVVLLRNELERAGVTPFSRWYDWCLLAAWVVAGTYLALAVRRPRTRSAFFCCRWCWPWSVPVTQSATRPRSRASRHSTTGQ
jgi:hypothetical protein